VEHPVTEMVTGIDIVKEQIRIAAGSRLSRKQEEVVTRGHSIECRINAEDPVTFMPSPGLITTFHPPGGPGVRVDSAVHSDCRISPYYDSLVAKLITYGDTRDEAISRMRRSLDVMVVEGIKTNIPLQKKILMDPDFIKGNFSTRFLERYVL
jgi:acetyl-CoA carboxylase biotin carboxylase subunit